MESDINEERAGQYCATMLELGVDIIEALLELTDIELKEEIGIKMLGDRAKIRKLKGFYLFLFFFFIKKKKNLFPFSPKKPLRKPRVVEQVS